MNDYLIKVKVNGDTVIQKMYADSMKNENKSLDFYLKDVIIASYYKENVITVIEMNSELRKSGVIYPVEI